MHLNDLAIKTIPVVFTNTATAACAIVNGVCFIIGMSLGAVGSFSLLSYFTNSPQHILSPCYCFKVVWVHTWRIAAQVVWHKPKWNVPVHEFIRKTMCWIQLSIDSEPSISITLGTSPYPTRCSIKQRAVFRDTKPKTLPCRHILCSLWHNCTNDPIAAETIIMQRTKAIAIMNIRAALDTTSVTMASYRWLHWLTKRPTSPMSTT